MQEEEQEKEAEKKQEQEQEQDQDQEVLRESGDTALCFNILQVHRVT